MDVDDGPRQHAPETDAQVDQGEVDPEIALPDARRHHCADHGIEARPEDATRGAEQSHGQGGHQGSGGKREQDVAKHLCRHAGEDDPPGAEPVDEGSGWAHDGHPSDGGHRQQAAGRLNRESTYLVQVDEAERQHQPGAQRLDGDSRQKELAVAWQVVPERHQRGVLTCRGGHRLEYGHGDDNPQTLFGQRRRLGQLPDG